MKKYKNILKNVLTNSEVGDIIKSTKENRERKEKVQVESTNEIYRKRGTDRQKLNLNTKQKNTSSIDIQMNKEQKIKFIDIDKSSTQKKK